VAAAAGGAGVWWVLGHGTVSNDGAVPVSMAEIITSSPDHASPRELLTAAESGSQPTASTLSETTGLPRTPPPARPTDASTSVHAPSSTTVADRRDPAPPPAEEPRADQPSVPPPGEVTAGDRHLVLDYIAFIPSDPFAQINGTEVRVGSELDDLVVKAISASEVVLLDPAGEEIHLRAR